MTRGYLDALEIARQHRYDMYDLQIEHVDPSRAQLPIKLPKHGRGITAGHIKTGHNFLRINRGLRRNGNYHEMYSARLQLMLEIEDRRERIGD